MSQQIGLLLKEPNLVESIASIFQRLKTNPSLQSDFMNSPAKILEGSALSRNEPYRPSIVGQFLFSVLSDERLARWLERYKNELGEEARSRERVLRDFSQALIEFGDVRIREKDDPHPNIEIDAFAIQGWTYLKSLNNKVFAVVKYKTTPPQQNDWINAEITPMQIVTLAEQILHSARTP
jgi:hypothetical protein